MKLMSILFVTLLAGGSNSAAALPSATPAASQKGAAIHAQQARAVRICERGRCYWTREHWGYGGSRWRNSDDWRRHDRYNRQREWDQDWRSW